jgi:hypothetical protein
MTQDSTFTEGRHIHKIIEKDVDSLKGVCSRCGPVALKKTIRKKYTQYQCAIAYRESNDTQNQRRSGVNTHGLNPSEVSEFVSDKVCNVCKTDLDVCVDHNHETHKLRGVLCRTHNLGLSFFGDDPVLLRRAADYLEGRLPVARSTRPTGDRFYGDTRSSTRRGRRASLL